MSQATTHVENTKCNQRVTELKNKLRSELQTFDSYDNVEQKLDVIKNVVEHLIEELQ